VTVQSHPDHFDRVNLTVLASINCSASERILYETVQLHNLTYISGRLAFYSLDILDEDLEMLRWEFLQRVAVFRSQTRLVLLNFQQSLGSPALSLPGGVQTTPSSLALQYPNSR